MYSVTVFLKMKIKDYVKLDVWILLSIYFFFNPHFRCYLINIEMEQKLTFLYTSNHKNWNHQIHSYSRRKKNEKKIFILIPHSHVANMALELNQLWHKLTRFFIANYGVELCKTIHKVIYKHLIFIKCFSETPLNTWSYWVFEMNNIKILYTMFLNILKMFN